MHESCADDDWVIWSAEHGLVTTVSIGLVEQGPMGMMAWLDEPFDMVGPFSLDTLRSSGRISFAEILLMSRLRWQQDQIALRRESQKIRREAQRRQHEEFSRYSQQRAQQQGRRGFPVDESTHRELLDLPKEGKLEVRQINTAFRRLAQKAHPDRGGDHEQFVRLSEARNVLLELVG